MARPSAGSANRCSWSRWTAPTSVSSSRSAPPASTRPAGRGRRAAGPPRPRPWRGRRGRRAGGCRPCRPRRPGPRRRETSWNHVVRVAGARSRGGTCAGSPRGARARDPSTCAARALDASGTTRRPSAAKTAAKARMAVVFPAPAGPDPEAQQRRVGGEVARPAAAARHRGRRRARLVDGERGLGDQRSTAPARVTAALDEGLLGAEDPAGGVPLGAVRDEHAARRWPARSARRLGDEVGFADPDRQSRPGGAADHRLGRRSRCCGRANRMPRSCRSASA